MSEPNRNQPNSQPDFLARPQTGQLETVRKRIVEADDAGEAREAFEELVAANCDPGLLLILLENVAKEGPALDTWEARFGVGDLRELRSVARRMRKCAEEFERLDKNGLLRLAAWPRFKNQFTPLEFLYRLSGTPELLRGCADAIEVAAKNPRFKPRAHGFSNTALAQLVAYVQHSTSAPRDREVSSLLGTLGKTGRNSEPYTADTLKTWRAEHAETIRHSAQIFPAIFGT